MGCIYSVAVKMYYKCAGTKWIVYNIPAALYDNRCAVYDVNRNPLWVRVVAGFWVIIVVLIGIAYAKQYN